MRDSSVAAKRGWLTTADVARILERTDRGARWIATEHGLPCEWTRRGQRLFREAAVRRLADQRAAARLRGVRVLRPRKVSVPVGDRAAALTPEAAVSVCRLTETAYKALRASIGRRRRESPSQKKIDAQAGQEKPLARVDGATQAAGGRIYRGRRRGGS